MAACSKSAVVVRAFTGPDGRMLKPGESVTITNTYDLSMWVGVGFVKVLEPERLSPAEKIMTAEAHPELTVRGRAKRSK